MFSASLTLKNCVLLLLVLLLGSGIVTLLAKVLYCLRRVIRSRRALFQSIFHPEVGATQYLLASVLQTALRHVSKSSALVKVSWHSHFFLAICNYFVSSSASQLLYIIGTEERMRRLAERSHFIKVIC